MMMIMTDSERADQYEEALQKIVQWSEAYPLDIFPEPDWDKVKALFANNPDKAMTLAQVSASCMRHVVEGVGEIAREALKKN